MENDSLSLPEGLVIRRLTEPELSMIQGGASLYRPQSSGMHEFVIEGEFDEPVRLGDQDPFGESRIDRAKSLLDKAILSLRTFKEGIVGYDVIHFRPLKFCPVGICSAGCGDKYVRHGRYSLTANEYPPLAIHAELLFKCSQPAMKMACSRLGDAQNRERVEDRIVDAVIGMEALLLAALGDDRGELSFKFSLNFAMLFETPNERKSAFDEAKLLYDCRSKIAHGATLNTRKMKLSGAAIGLEEVGNRATKALRTVVMRFLEQDGQPAYKDHVFWQRKYFGFPDVEAMPEVS